ncbi:hypothetical protein NSND_62494 [Nitrospira sp. ND1]|nr:hypothetical protein NSND_62494 [Nitrospira sp. ND1]
MGDGAPWAGADAVLGRSAESSGDRGYSCLVGDTLTGTAVGRKKGVFHGWKTDGGSRMRVGHIGGVVLIPPLAVRQ